MAEISAAQALFPNLPSTADAAPAPAAADRLAATSIYGGPEGGVAVARGVMDAGRAQPAGALKSEPVKPASPDWLGDALKDRGDSRSETKEAPERTPAAAASKPLDLKGLNLEPGPMATQFSELAGEVGLDRAKAAKMVELHQAAVVDASARYWDGVDVDWQKASMTQFGSRLPSMVDAVKPLLADKQLTTPGFRALLDQYRLGSNPDVIRTLYNFAQALGRRR